MNKDILLKTLSSVKLKKIKSKMVREALEQRVSSKGNHNVTYFSDREDQQFLIFAYRGTAIVKLRLHDFDVESLHAGVYENTPATIRQRKEIHEAINEIVRVIGVC